MGYVINGPAYVGNPAGSSSGRLAVHNHDSFNFAFPVGRETSVHLLGGYTVSPVAGYEVNLQTQLLCHGLPEDGKLTRFEHQYFVTRRECVHDRGFPSSGSG